MGGLHPSEIYAADLIPSDFTVEEDVAPTLKSVDNIEIISVLNEGESAVNCREMCRRAKAKNANLGFVDLKVLWERRNGLSAEVRQFRTLFPGTVMLSQIGRPGIIGLGWFDGQWYLDFIGLDDDLGANDRLARLKCVIA